MPDPLVVANAPTKAMLPRVFSDIMNRMKWFGGWMGGGFGGKRDLDTVFGYPKVITLQEIQMMYNRGGIARRIAHAYPDATWGRPPEIFVDNSTGPGDPAWDETWEVFARKFQLWQSLYRLDVLAGLGRYGILLMGTDKGTLNQPLSGNLLYLQPYMELHSQITRWNNNVNSPNFGLPQTYRINPNLTTEGTQQLPGFPMSTVMPFRPMLEIDASRILHVCHDGLENQVFGRPVYSPVYDHLLDLRKVIGSAAESYWLTAYKGINADVDKDLELTPDDEANLSAEVDEYLNGFKRFIRTRGVKINDLGSDVADPSGAFKALVTLIAGATGIPQRILLGSEAGQLASTQDKGNWAERVEEYRMLHAEPYILIPLITKLIAAGTIPEPKGGIEKLMINWPDAYRMSPLERGQTSAQTARTLANVSKAMEPIITGYNQQTQTMPGAPGPDGEPGQETTAIVETPIYGPPLITREEARAIIGISTDNKVMAKEPQV